MLEAVGGGLVPAACNSLARAIPHPSHPLRCSLVRLWFHPFGSVLLSTTQTCFRSGQYDGPVQPLDDKKKEAAHVE